MLEKRFPLAFDKSGYIAMFSFQKKLRSPETVTGQSITSQSVGLQNLKEALAEPTSPTLDPTRTMGFWVNF